MPADLTVHRRGRYALVRLTGRVTGQEIAQTAAAISGHRTFKRDFRVIWDATGAAELDVPTDAFEALLVQERRFRDAGEDGELVFVVRDDVWASLVTLFAAKMRDRARPMTVVPTLAAAKQHLGVS